MTIITDKEIYQKHIAALRYTLTTADKIIADGIIKENQKQVSSLKELSDEIEAYLTAYDTKSLKVAHSEKVANATKEEKETKKKKKVKKTAKKATKKTKVKTEKKKAKKVKAKVKTTKKSLKKTKVSSKKKVVKTKKAKSKKKSK